MKTLTLETLTLDVVTAAAERVLDRFGREYIYNPKGEGSCAYVPTTDSRYPTLYRAWEEIDPVGPTSADKSGCFVGEILSDLGLMTDEIAGSTKSVSDILPVGAAYNVMRYLATAQSAQDCGHAWGAAHLNGLAEAHRNGWRR